MADAIFAQLQQGLRFDKKKWGKHIALFEQPAGQQASRATQQTAAPPAPVAAAAAPPAASSAKQQQKKKKKRGAADATGSQEAAAVDGIAVFGGQPDGDGSGAAAVPAAFVDNEPVVATGDPYEEANVIRKAHRIKVSGSAPPAPLRSYADLDGKPGCCRRLLSNLADGGFVEPTPIQRQAITALLAGRELLAVAPTGSGKTLGFLLPLIMMVRALRRQQELELAAAAAAAQEAAGEGAAAAAPAPGGSGTKAVVVSPTKELSVQTARVLQLLLPGLRIRCSVLSKSTAAGTDFSKVDVLLAQPLRLGALADEGGVDLSGVRLLVLDEADKLFDMGFTEQVDAVIAACRHPSVVRALFSATLPESVEGLARSVLQDPLRITVGERNTAASTVSQRLVFVGREEAKLPALRQLVTQGLRPPVLVFVATKERAKELHRELMFDGVHVDSIHADQSGAARAAAVDNFRLGRTWVLVATDLIGRGMDFAGVATVVNYDFPRSTTDYIHRVGRTGRAGRTGEAITFFKEEDAGQLRSIAHVVKAAGSDVPDWMLALPKDKRHRKQQPQQAQQQLGSGAGEAGPPTGPSGGKPRQQQQQQGGSKQKKQKKPPQQGLRRPAKRAKQ